MLFHKMQEIIQLLILLVYVCYANYDIIRHKVRYGVQKSSFETCFRQKLYFSMLLVEV
jgi:hypothetical protein